MLVENEIEGPYSYCAGYVVPAQAQESETVHPLQALKGTPTEDAVQTLTIEVALGVPFLMGSVTTKEGAYPTGVTVTLTDPNGNQVGPSQTDACLVVCVNNDPTMIQSCMIQYPTTGTWTVTVTNADSSSYVFFSTMPTAAQYPTIVNTLSPYLDPEAMGAAPEGATGCWICQVGCWAVAVALTVSLVVAAGLLTTTAAPVVALGALLGSMFIVVAAETIVLALQALMAGTVATVLIVVNNICTWLNACSTGVTAKITSPATGTTVSGTTHVSASAPDAITVTFYVNENTPIGTDNTAPNWDTDWDTAKFKNGTHTVWALATGAGSKGSAWSPQVSVTVRN
jgi:hypothetical protein